MADTRNIFDIITTGECMELQKLVDADRTLAGARNADGISALTNGDDGINLHSDASGNVIGCDPQGRTSLGAVSCSSLAVMTLMRLTCSCCH